MTRRSRRLQWPDGYDWWGRTDTRRRGDRPCLRVVPVAPGSIGARAGTGHARLRRLARQLWHHHAQPCRAAAPLYLNPRFDGPRLRWLLGFARHCNWTDFHRAATARSAILQRSRRLLGELVRDEALDCEFAEEGELYVYRSVPAMVADERHHAAVLDRLGIEVRRLRGDVVEAMEPALKPGVVGGLFHPGDARLRPDRYVAELARRVRELGGVIESGARIESFDVDGRRITQVRTS